MQEWSDAGRSAKEFGAADKNQDQMLSAEELHTASPSDRFFSTAKKLVAPNTDTDLTPLHFRSPPGARVYSFDF